ncbi:MAG: hypothetical protein JWN70_1648, partial [Planctomycetaceae bacterium]|nr:hypothetical protein [Planctomycetaceae bacterium]
MRYTRVVGVAGGLVLVIVAVLGGIYAIWPRPRLNVLLVTFDTTRADHIGCYGHPGAKTPALDGLADRGVLFEKAYTPIPLTMPSHATMFTGLYPPEHGLGRLEASIPTLAEILRKDGYATGAFVASSVLASKYGLNRGFQVYDEDLGHQAAAADEDHGQRAGNFVVDAALAWLQRQRSKRHFCWVHLFDPHAPYLAHEDLFGDEFKDRPYDGDIAFADQQLARLLDFLKREGLEGQTLVVVVGDHGEGFSEHGESTHGQMVYNPTLHVPLVVATPHSPARRHHVPGAVPLVDLLPTILECVHLPSPTEISGRSLRQALWGQPLEPRRCFALSDAPYLLHGWAPLRALITDEFKYIRTTRNELYNLTTDPGETRNLVRDLPDQARDMDALLAEMEAKMVTHQASAVALSPAEQRTLKSLGYAAGSSRPDRPKPQQTLHDIKDMIGPAEAATAAENMVKRGAVDEGLAKLRAVIKAAPDFVAPRISLAEFLLLQQKRDEAIAVLKEVLKIAPQSNVALFHLAKATFAAGKIDEAISLYQQAVEIDPSFE